MPEIIYDKDTLMLGGYPKIKKLGACSPNGEMTPFVWNGRLMRYAAFRLLQVVF